MAHKSHKLFLNLSFLLLLLTLFLTTHNSAPSTPPLRHLTTSPPPTACQPIEALKDYAAKCSYLRSHNNPCPPRGYIDYLSLFYCVSGRHPSIGYSLLALWLTILFYLLGTTASQYFCSSLEGLSGTLRLPPTVAGVTLLALGNGAPDVFSSIASFSGGAGAGHAAGEVGISSVLGGGFFVSTVVVGIIGICVGPAGVVIDRSSFIRDAGFFVVVLGSLLLMLINGEINLWGSICFASLYIAYVVVVWVSQCRRDKRSAGALDAPLLNGIKIENQPPPPPQAAVEVQLSNLKPDPDTPSLLCNWIIYILEMPLDLPRRLTIPDVSEDRWSKPLAVASVALAPILLATLWASGKTEETMHIYLISLVIGIALSISAMVTTKRSRPPQKWRLPWLAGGFTMSVVWTYITAGELVALLVAAGHILNISPELLGLTVLAWGNSLGDLIANVAMAVGGGADGAQIAISGCYAGPIFNTLVGLGLSMVVAAWGSYPAPVTVGCDGSVYETVGFLVGGVAWALVVVPRRGMRMDRVVGIGLLGIYVGFLCLRLSQYTYSIVL